jgi:hypothetical protein
MKKKFGFSYYRDPTPKNIRRFGNALLSISGFVAASSFATENETIGYVFLGVGIIGKFLTIFFKEEA